jgi:hypothetical protein
MQQQKARPLLRSKQQPGRVVTNPEGSSGENYA